MSLLWFDGAESYTDAADMQLLEEYKNSNPYQFGTTYGRRGSRGWDLSYTGRDIRTDLQNTLSDNTTIIVGFAAYCPVAGNFGYDVNYPWLLFGDGNGNTHIKMQTTTGTRKLEVRNGANVLLGSGTAIIPVNEWFFLEIKITISTTVGIVQTRIDGMVDIDLTGKDTQTGSNAYVGMISPKMFYNKNIWIDDYYICNAQGSKNNDFLGDIRIDILRPNAAGTYTDFTPSAGSNYQNVDEEPGPDDDTTYNDGANVGNQDSYQMPDLPAPAGTTIYGVKVQGTVRKTDAGGRKCKLLTRAGTTDDLGNDITLSDTYTTHTKILENNPADSLAWEDSDIDSIEIGTEITA